MKIFPTPGAPGRWAGVRRDAVVVPVNSLGHPGVSPEDLLACKAKGRSPKDCLREASRSFGQTLWRVMAAAALLVVSGCVTPRMDVARTPSEAFSHPDRTTLGRAYAAPLSGRPGESGIHVLDVGTDAFLARAALADAAERALDLQYYSMRNGRTTRLLADRLVAAARRGVRVRLLLDGMDAAGQNREIGALASHPNIEVRLFNPFSRQGASALWRLAEFVGDGERLNRRMHNKLWIADGATAIVGGRNLGDEYFDSRPDVNFTDLDLLVVGPVVPQLSRSFDEFWNSDWAVPVSTAGRALAGGEGIGGPAGPKASPPADAGGMSQDPRAASSDWVRRLTTGSLPMTWAPAHAVYDRPAKIQIHEGDDLATHMGPHLRDIGGAAQADLLLISPYFIPGEAGLALLGRLTQRGVRVRVLTNSLASTDVPLVHFGYARYRVEMLRQGVHLYELRPAEGVTAPHDTRLFARSGGASLHAKAFIVDGRIAFVGSMNFDPRSRHLNTELGVVVHSPALAAELAGIFDEAFEPHHSFRVSLGDPLQDEETLAWITEENGQEVRYRDEPLAGFVRRWWFRALSILVPEDVL